MSNLANSRVVFVVTSQGNDFYSAMTRVAIASLRMSNPELSLMVVCDHETDQALRCSCAPLRNDVDEWLAVDVPSGSAGFRNRFVKTRLRELLSGPFLFLDSDVFVRDDLSGIFIPNADIAGARNHSQADFSRQIWDRDVAVLNEMHWKIGGEVYLNGGVLFCNDTPAARTFWAEWHQRWLRSFSALGVYRDQPALNSALFATQPRLSLLDDRYNAQVKTNAFVAKDAVLWHFYSDSHVPGYFDFDDIVGRVLKTGQLDFEAVKAFSRRQEPWRNVAAIDELVGRRISSKGYASRWEIAWLSGARLRGIRYLLNDMFTRRGRRPIVA